MRDILLVAIVFGAIPFILRRPQIGVMMWVWVSVMNPHRLAWGFATTISFGEIVAIATLASALVNTLFGRGLRKLPLNATVFALLLFAAWTGITTVFALYPAEALEKYKVLMKTVLMTLLIPMLFHREDDLRKLVWVLALSVAYYGTKGGAWILLTGGGERVWGPAGSYIQDNNALAVAVTMTIPLLRYLQLTSPHRAVRYGLALIMLLCGVSIVGSYSRGALLAASAMVMFLCWKSRHRWRLFLVAIVTIPLVLGFMPEKWFARMETIRTYQADSSANMRLNSWGTMINLARDRPVTGGGFEVATEEVYRKWAPDPRFPPQVAHSIYFQALGEHGFVGLALYLMLLAAAWRLAGRTGRAAAAQPSTAWARDLCAMMQVSFVGYAVGGAFLSLVNFDVPYYLMAVLVATQTIVRRTQTPAAASVGPPAAFARSGASALARAHT